MGVAETYADYMPSKLKLGRKHPDPVVETASLSSVPPADVWYKLSIPEETINSGALSALQLESITYAAQQHEHILPDGSRAGFLIGDGAGVGKGRTIAGVIYENYLKGKLTYLALLLTCIYFSPLHYLPIDIHKNSVDVYESVFSNLFVPLPPPPFNNKLALCTTATTDLQVTFLMASWRHQGSANG